MDGVSAHKMVQYNPGDMVRTLSEQAIFNQISRESIKYYAPFYDNDLFGQYGIVLKFKNNSATVRFINSLEDYIVHTDDLMYIA